jgi:peptide/nickel transport system ATP-binding protein
MSNIVDLQDVFVRFYTYEGVVKALDGVDLHVEKGETLGLVGETGCGKSMTGLSIFNLIPSPGRIESGKIFFTTRKGKTENILGLEEKDLQEIRGADVSMIFQEPSVSLNPVYAVNDQVSEVFLAHRKEALIKNALSELEKEIDEKGSKSLRGRILGGEVSIYRKMVENPNSLLLRTLSKIPIVNRYYGRLKNEAKKETINLLNELSIPDPERVVDMYPHELSGGMQQRVVIAMALACNPLLLVADEPTTSLDVTIQARILELIRTMKKRFDVSVLFITHDLGVIAEMCDRVAVMYAGNIVEVANVMEIFKNPFHPYTKALLESIPMPGKEYKTIEGTVPNLINPPSGCRFHTRCPYVMDVCPKVKPQLIEVSKNHFVSCHLFDGQEK